MRHTQNQALNASLDRPIRGHVIGKTCSLRVQGFTTDLRCYSPSGLPFTVCVVHFRAWRRKQWARRSPGFSRGGRIPLQTGLKKHAHTYEYRCYLMLSIIVIILTNKRDTLPVVVGEEGRIHTCICKFRRITTREVTTIFILFGTSGRDKDQIQNVLNIKVTR
jgi:hypothetical protein